MKKIFVIVSFLFACSAGIATAQTAKPEAATKPQTEVSGTDKKAEKSCCKKGGEASKSSCSDKKAKSSCCSKGHSDATKSEGSSDVKKKD